MSQWFWQWLRLPGWPPVPRRLWLTLAGFVLCWFNNLFIREIWPHVPWAGVVFSVGEWLLLLGIFPQLLGLAWGWLRSWQGPALLRWLATAWFLAVACLAALAWLVLLGCLGSLLSGVGHG